MSKKKVKFNPRKYNHKNMPKCFDSVDNWREWNRLSFLADKPGAPFCTDCMPAFKQEMLTSGRCRHPAVRFITIEKSGTRLALEGRRPAAIWRQE